MTKNLVTSIALVLVGNFALAGMKPCNENIKVEDPKNILDRTQKLVLSTIPKKTLETIAGSNTYQGIGYEIIGGGKCIIASRDAQDDMSQFARRDQRSVNCVIETATSIPLVLTDRAVDFAAGSIEFVGDAIKIDASNVAKMGINIAADDLNRRRENLNQNKNGFMNFLGSAGDGFLAVISGSGGVVTTVVGEVLNAVGARLRVIYEIPKDILQQSIRGVGQLAELNPGNAGKSGGQIAWRLVSAVPNLVMGCENAYEPLNLNDPQEFERYQHERAGSSF